MKYVALLVALMLISCGGSSQGSRTANRVEEENVVKAPTQGSSAQEPGPLPAQTVTRAALTAVLDQGLGRLFQHLVVAPHFVDKEFVGFRIESLPPQVQGLALGDVITAVNGRPVERPEEVLKTWEALREVSMIQVMFHRDGHPQRLEIAVVDAAKTR